MAGPVHDADACSQGGQALPLLHHPSDELQQGAPPAWRLPAKDLELLVVARLQQFFSDRNATRAMLPCPAPSASMLVATPERAAEASVTLGTSHGRATLVAKLLTEVRVDGPTPGWSRCWRKQMPRAIRWSDIPSGRCVTRRPR